jgi:hypothetical protein
MTGTCHNQPAAGDAMREFAGKTGADGRFAAVQAAMDRVTR